MSDGVSVPCAVNAVAGDVQAKPMGAENVFGIAERDRLAVAPVPGRAFNATRDFEFADRRLAELAGADPVTLEELAGIGHGKHVGEFADLDGKLALVDANPVTSADHVARQVVGFL